MTVTTGPGTKGGGGEVAPQEDLVTVTIDGHEVSVVKGTLLIRAAELLGIQVPRFCDHPLLDPVGACRQCLVEVPDMGNGRGMPKPAASCTTTVMPGMVVKTQLTSPVADKAQQGVMELLLVNHPLDCPVCDKGGECPLQNQAMSNGRGETRYEGVKRTYPKPVRISTQVLLDRERCVLCARCTRFAQQVAGDPFIELLERGALQQVGIDEDEPFQSYFSGNTIQICPVGALTSAAYRFRARPFDLVSSPSVCEHCASGCALRTDHRRGTVVRRLAGDDPQVNEEWNCDKGRFAFRYADTTAAGGRRLTTPLVRDEDGELVPTSWPDALATAAEGLRRARAAGGVGVLAGGRLTVEDAYAYAKLARVALGTNDVDFRARPHSAEEADVLGAVVAGRLVGSAGAVTYADLERAPAVVLAGLEPEEESPIVFLRLRKAARRGGMAVHVLAPFLSRGAQKLTAALHEVLPGAEAEALDALADATGSGPAWAALREPGAVLLVGERLAEVPGALTAAAHAAAAAGARLAWVPRRAGERGALEAGALPTLLPGGRPVADPAARVDVATAWGVPSLPAAPGRDTAGILAAAGAGALGGLVVGGVDVEDLPDPVGAQAALGAAGFVVSLEVRESAVTALADVVLPVAPVVEKAGTFLDWEGRPRPFDRVLPHSSAMSDARVLDGLAGLLGAPLGVGDVSRARRELDELGPWEGARVDLPLRSGTAAGATGAPGAAAAPGAGEALLATGRLLLDGGRLEDGEPFLAGTARPPRAHLSPATAAEVGVAPGERVLVRGARGAVRLPVEVVPMPDRVVWLPVVPGLRRQLAAAPGTVVALEGGEPR
ncbi:NADH-quinone oxidoreductase subunit G [Vallicoccus soli]|uniref:NADH-quinone oxidoreductase n=1 Tax=Vallicoccus soli TaxID=2339232 RepID=A0A3A3ZEG7_9ACTN|nr:NADH-quinone oxidoreductase subunit G [Vallicoccus soli]RJK93409.1 NADH-quinone oxidoreductase subunit G [Vallicoccus soli]